MQVGMGSSSAPRSACCGDGREASTRAPAGSIPRKSTRRATAAHGSRKVAGGASHGPRRCIGAYTSERIQWGIQLKPASYSHTCYSHRPAARARWLYAHTAIHRIHHTRIQPIHHTAPYTSPQQCAGVQCGRTAVFGEGRGGKEGARAAPPRSRPRRPRSLRCLRPRPHALHLDWPRALPRPRLGGDALGLM